MPMTTPAITRRRLASSIAWRGILSGVVGGALIYLYLSALAPEDPSEVAEVESPLEEIVLAAALLPIGFFVIRRRVALALEWFEAGRRPTPAERGRLLRTSTGLALAGLTLWIVAAAAVGTYNAASGSTTSELVQSVAGVAFGGLVSTGMTFGLTERRMRPLYSDALRGGVPDAARVLGVRSRLLLAWSSGSAVPLLAIAVALVGRTPGERADMTASIWFLVAVGLVAGGVTMLVVASAASVRLEAARRAMQDVRAGMYGVALDVDDASEIGSLQAGFNEMAAGLRERQRLEDLFGRHVGVEVARRALEAGLELGGEERSATVIFVDLAGSTALACRVPAVEVVSMLNRFFDAIAAAVAGEGGWINKFHGDGALCVFGVPQEQLDHAERALRAAIAMSQSLRSLDVDFGVGVSSGLVVAGNVGSEDRFEYTVIGDPVNEAARLCDVAKELPTRVAASGAVITAATERSSTAGTHTWRQVSTVTLRGRDTETSVFSPHENA